MENINLAEKLAMQLALHSNPVVIMNQLMFKRVFPSLWPLPGDGTTYFDSISNLKILIDNNIPADRIDITDSVIEESI